MGAVKDNNLSDGSGLAFHDHGKTFYVRIFLNGITLCLAKYRFHHWGVDKCIFYEGMHENDEVRT